MSGTAPPVAAPPPGTAWRRDLAVTLLALAAVLAWDLSGLDLALTRLWGTAGGFPWREHVLTATVLLFLPILMPLLASIGASFGAVFDYERRAARYHDIAASLSRTARILPTLNTLPEISTAVRLTEETLLGELIEWFAAQRKGLGH
jgi:hypothetical protein